MPVHVDIRINEKRIASLHIGRLDRFSGTDAGHAYEAVLLEPPLPEGEPVPWGDGVLISHRYDDGVYALVSQALEMTGVVERENGGRNGKNN